MTYAITTEQLKEILDAHAEWLDDYTAGDRADLRVANLKGVNLHGLDLRAVDLSYANLHGADLSYANLRSADMRDANLSGVNLDFSSGIPLWCGGSKFECRGELIQQVLAHLCTLDCKNEEWIALRKVIMPFARKSHQACDLGLIKQKKG